MKIQLLDLPLEMIREIIETAITVNGLSEATTYCLVCRLFDEEIPQAVYRLRLLENIPIFKTQRQCEMPVCDYRRLYLSYLCSWALDNTRSNNTHWMPTRIQHVLARIITAAPELRPSSREIVVGLCTFITNQHDPRSALYLLCPEMRTLNSLRPVIGYYPYRQHTSGCTLDEDLLGASSLLGLTAVARSLLEKHVNIRKLTHFGNPLFNAVNGGYLDIVKILFQGGREASLPRGKAIELAIRRRRVEILGFLLEEQNIPEGEEDGDAWVYLRSHLDDAVLSGQDGTVRWILEFIEGKSFMVYSPRTVFYRPGIIPYEGPMLDRIYDFILHMAVQHDKASIIRLALEKGANPNVSPTSRSPLETAISHGDEGILKILLEHGAHPDNEGIIDHTLESFMAESFVDWHERMWLDYKKVANAMKHWHLKRLELPEKGWEWIGKKCGTSKKMYLHTDDPSDYGLVGVDRRRVFIKISEDKLLEHFYARQGQANIALPRRRLRLPPKVLPWLSEVMARHLWSEQLLQRIDLSSVMGMPRIDGEEPSQTVGRHFVRGEPMRRAVDLNRPGVVKLLLEYGASKEYLPEGLWEIWSRLWRLELD